MIITLKTNDLFSNVLNGFRPSESYGIKFKFDWQLGHTVQINDKVYTHYKAEDEIILDNKPVLNLANMGNIDNVTLTVEVNRYNS